MAPPRPHNHVTEATAEARNLARIAGERWPEVPAELVAYLQTNYPPACYRPREETLETHLLYAGSVLLVDVLAAVAEDQRLAALALDPEDGTGLSVEVGHPEQED